MISKQQFKAQVSRMGALFMRETPNNMLREMYEIFKDKDLDVFVKAVSGIISQEERFPSPRVIQDYYEAHLPKEVIEPPIKADLERAAKTTKHKEYLNLIYGLMDEAISIDNPGVQKCLNEQGSNRIFSHYDKRKRGFVKKGREPMSPEQVEKLRKQAQKRIGIQGTYMPKKIDYFKELREKLGLTKFEGSDGKPVIYEEYLKGKGGKQ